MILKIINYNESIDIEGIAIYYNYSENAGEKQVTYKLSPDGWYPISVPAGPCIIRNVPLILKLDGVVYVEQINDSAFKVHMKVKLTNNFDNDIGGYKLVIKNNE